MGNVTVEKNAGRELEKQVEKNVGLDAEKQVEPTNSAPPPDQKEVHQQFTSLHRELVTLVEQGSFEVTVEARTGEAT